MKLAQRALQKSLVSSQKVYFSRREFGVKASLER
jgi:hypothetical protein